MPSDRVQEAIDRHLDAAVEAAAESDWDALRQHAASVLRLDPDNEDAKAFMAAADRDTAATPSVEPRSSEPQPDTPSAFAGGRYEVREFLGEGGKKRVFLAHDSLLDREVAFALIRTERLDDTGRERITREAQAMARLGDHPHIVQVFDLGQETSVDGSIQMYIVSQYMAGGTVEDLLAADEPLLLERALEIAAGVCGGLETAHRYGFVHRDLKPGNIWLALDGTAKIGDFGLAVALGRTRLTAEGAIFPVGTVSYMPPEQAVGGEVTPQSDLYSLGVMLYEMVTGRPPFVSDDPWAVVTQHLETPPVAPSWHSEHCPPALEELILHLLAKMPADRPASASHVVLALELIDPQEVSASHSGSGANPLDRLARGVFVGRQPELGRLRGAFDDAFAGRGSVAMIVGEPGVGKTRISQELATYARMRGAQVLWGRTHESAGAPAYWPWVRIATEWGASRTAEQIVRLGESMPPDAPSELSRIIPWLRGTVPEPPDVTQPEIAQFRLFEAYTAFVRTLSIDSPLVLVLDDLHWADKPSLLLLQHLGRELAGMRVLVIGTFRDTDLSRTSTLSETNVELNREGGFMRLALVGLTREETEGYIHSTANSLPPREFVDRIFAETEGNPFFLSEVVSLMTQEGTLTADSVPKVVIPNGVREAIGRRLDRLSKECNRFLTIAAVVGREFTFDTLGLLYTESESELVGYIDEGLGGRVIEEMEGRVGHYRFTHAQIQETLLAKLSTTRLVHLNGEIAEALEQRYGDQSEERAARLARHFFESSTLRPGHAEKALRYCRLAAEQAEAQLGWGEAARRYEDCLSVIAAGAGIPDSDRASLLEALGRCYIYDEQFRSAWRSLLSAIDLYRCLANRDGGGRATDWATRWVPAPAERHAALLNAALDAPGEFDPVLEVRLLSMRSSALMQKERSDDERSRDEARAKELAAELDLADVRASLLYWDAVRVHQEFDETRVDESARLYRESVLAAEQVGDRAAAAVAKDGLSWLLLATGRLDEAESAITDLIQYARAERFRYHEQNGLGTLALLLMLRGDLDRAREIVSEIPPGSFLIEVTAALIAEREGVAELAAVELPSPELGGGVAYFQLQIHGSRARALHFAADDEQARAELRPWADALTRFTDTGPFSMPKLAAAGSVIAELADEETVRRAYDHITRARTVRVGSGSTADEFRGALALRLDLVDEAGQHYHAGLEWCERERCPIEAGRNHQGLAEVAVRRGNTDEAKAHLDAASKLFEQYGAKLYLDQVIAKKLELQGVSPSDGSGNDTVPAGEPEVTPKAPEPGETLPSGGAEGD